MKPSRLILAVLGAALLVATSACGGSADVPAGAVAVVDGTEISKEELDQLLARTKQGFEAQDQEFPKAGTPEFLNLQQQTLAFLVQREQFEQAADELEVTVSDQDIDKELDEFVKSRFDGNRKEFEKALEDQGFTLEDFRETLHTSVLSQKLFDEVTKDVEVTDEDVTAYYNANQAQYRTAESRDVRHILIAEKKANGDVDFAKSKGEADRIYAELDSGGDFAALARANSDDPGSKASGGKLTITRGQTVPEFDTTSFTLEKNQLSRPVKTQYGYHVIEALSEVRKAKTTPLAQVRESIRATLLQEKRNEVMTTWAEDLRSDYESKVSYATGFAPPELPDAPEETDAETE